MNAIDRLGRLGAVAMHRAVSIIMATPDALSSAPG